VGGGQRRDEALGQLGGGFRGGLVALEDVQVRIRLAAARRHALARPPGLSILYDAGGGLFCYSHDMLNMTHIGETLRAMGWRPPAAFNPPPCQPERDVLLPPAWAHLEPSRAR